MQKASLNRRASPVLLPNRRRIRTPSPGLPEGSMSPPLSLHDGLAALHEAATSPERQARALSAALPRFQDAPQVWDAPKPDCLFSVFLYMSECNALAAASVV